MRSVSRKAESWAGKIPSPREPAPTRDQRPAMRLSLLTRALTVRTFLPRARRRIYRAAQKRVKAFAATLLSQKPGRLMAASRGGVCRDLPAASRAFRRRGNAVWYVSAVWRAIRESLRAPDESGKEFYRAGRTRQAETTKRWTPWDCRRAGSRGWRDASSWFLCLAVSFAR